MDSYAEEAEICDQISVFVLHNVFEEGTPGYLLLKALRCYIEVDIYASLEVHTKKTITSGREKLTHFYELINVSLLYHVVYHPNPKHMLLRQEYIMAEKPEDLETKSWNFPKIHSLQHIFDDIVAKGASRNFNSKTNESLNRPLKRKYFRSNFKDVAEQVNQIVIGVQHWLITF